MTLIDILLYWCPMIIFVIIASIMIKNKISEELEYSKCISIGTVCLGLLAWVVSFVPGLNIVGMICLVTWVSAENWETIQEFFEKPICFWRK